MWQKNRSIRRKNHSRVARYSDQTDKTWSRLPKASETSGLLSEVETLTNKLPCDSGGVHCITKSPSLLFLSNLHHREGSNRPPLNIFNGGRLLPSL